MKSGKPAFTSPHRQQQLHLSGACGDRAITPIARRLIPPSPNQNSSHHQAIDPVRATVAEFRCPAAIAPLAGRT